MPENTANTKQLFYDIAGFPNVIGDFYCTHVALTNVADDDEHIYVNRKG